MVLVDTSVWIEYLGPRPDPVADQLDEVVLSGEPFALTGLILQEVLQGTRSVAEFAKVKKYLITQRILSPADPIQTYVQAAEMYFHCRRSGITPRSSNDCLIAQIAIEHSARLLHRDADFNRIAEVVPELKLC